LFNEAIRRGWAVTNPASAKALKRDRLKGGDIEIFSPEDGRKILDGVADELKAFTSLWMLSGLRKEEIARIDWSQVDAGLASGSIFLRADQAKTGRPRSIELC